jgi:hypothetical protein
MGIAKTDTLGSIKDAAWAIVKKVEQEHPEVECGTMVDVQTRRDEAQVFFNCSLWGNEGKGNMVIDIRPSKQTWLMVVNTAEGGLWLTGTLE